MEREKIMEDFPLWLKLLVWLIVGGTMAWTIAAMFYWGLGTS
jgi:hypothetical protein